MIRTPSDTTKTTKPSATRVLEFVPQPIERMTIPVRLPMIVHFHQVRAVGGFTLNIVAHN